MLPCKYAKIVLWLMLGNREMVDFFVNNKISPGYLDFPFGVVANKNNFDFFVGTFYRHIAAKFNNINFSFIFFL